jgi:ADP-ribose pyrophosphatase YjhB (NUDIX family)
VSRFVPAGAHPSALSGIALRPVQLPNDPATIDALTGCDDLDPHWAELPEGAPPIRKAGAIIREPDGRVWVIVPTNHFANTTATFPKGGIEPGEGARLTAWREVFEETDLVVQLEKHIGTTKRRNSRMEMALKTWCGFWLSWAMRNGGCILVVAAMLAASSTDAVAQEPHQRAAAIFAALRVGQKVDINDRGQMIVIKLLDDGTMGSYTVVEIGATNLQLEDFSKTTHLWIPVTAIQRVEWTRLPLTNPAHK